MTRKRVCSIEGCGRPSYVRGWCSRHYDRWRAHGDPLAGRPTPGFRSNWIKDHVSYSGDDCLFPPFSPGDRGVVSVEGKRMRAYRYMCILVHGEPKRPDLLACHTCRGGDAGCVNPRHLYWGTHAQNQDDRVRDGTDSRGSLHGASKLTEEDVLAIRQEAEKGALHKSLAKKYGVARQTIGDIVNRRRWAWLEPHRPRQEAAPQHGMAYGAGMGGIAAGAKGAAAGHQNQQSIVQRCLTGRGYSVVGR